MEVIFSGVGEAFDEYRTNVSLIVTHRISGQLYQILLDCGFSAAHAYWRYAPEPLNLDLVWISHFHGDHFLGLPLLMLRFWEENRRKPLTILGPQGIEEKVNSAMNLAYPNFLQRIQYPIHYQEADPSQTFELAGTRWSFADSDHSQSCLAVKIVKDDMSLFYSGDGRATPSSEALAKNCTLVVHEAFTIKGLQGGHGTVEECIAFARRTQTNTLALVHLNREVRNQQSEMLQQTIQGIDDLTILLPESGDTVRL
jgi:ribonuclease BN (tRNA processing enzyme)